MAVIYLQRHTTPNVAEGTCYGVTDVALTHPLFEMEELPMVLTRLKGIEFNKAYSSPLQRCKILADNLSNDLHIDERLLELNFGDWEMLSWNDIEKTKEGENWFADYLNCRTPNGEGFPDLIARAKSFLDDVKDIDGNLLVVTHSGFIRAAMVAIGAVETKDAFTSEIGYGDSFKIEGGKISKL